MKTLACLLLLLLCGCGSNSTKRESALRINIPSEPATMDPRKGGDVVSSCMHFMLFEGLTRLNPDSSTSPAQAEKIDISEDRKTYTFFIRQDAFWSDGSPVTAQDFEKSWKDILNPTFPSVNAHLLYPIKNAEAAKRGDVPLDQVGIHSKDNKTLVVELEMPTPYFLQLTSFCVLFPVNAKVDGQHADWAYHADEHYVCNGPFRLESWKHHHELTVVKSPTYWNTQGVHLDKICVSMVDNEMTALQMYERGELDMLGAPFSSLPIDAIQELCKKGLLNIQPSAATTVNFFNVNKFPFNNVNMRRAFALAINREALVKNITQLNEPIARGIIPPCLKMGRDVHFIKDADVAEARLLFQKGLEELGTTPADLKITFSYGTSEVNHKIAQAIQQQWQEAFGIQVQLENLERKILMDKMNKRTHTVALYSWIAQYDDQMNIFERFKSKNNVKNYPGWENEEYVRLLNASAYDATPEERFATLEKAETIFMNETPATALYHWNNAFIQKPYLHNVYLSSIGDVYMEMVTMDPSDDS